MWASCGITRDCLWSETQVRLIKDSDQAIWDSDHEIVRAEWLITLRRITPPSKWIEWPPKPNNYFGSKRPPTLKFYKWESEAKVQGWKKTLMQSLKKFHACFYQFYEKSTTQANVSLQGLHMSNTFWWSNILASVGLKSFCPWCLKMGGNTETITVHLREVHYRMVNVCDICQSYTSMNTQVIPDHCSGC